MFQRLSLNTHGSVFFLVEENHTPEKSVIFDVIGDISAGYDGVINEEKTGDSFAVPLDWIQGHAPQDFMLLKVRGGSMMPLIQNNDLCLIQRQTTMDYSGQIGNILGQVCPLYTAMWFLLCIPLAFLTRWINDFFFSSAKAK